MLPPHFRSKPVIMKKKDIHFEVPFEKEDIPFEIGN